MAFETAHLTAVTPRDVWKLEATDFTQWLAKEDNLAALAAALRLDELELEGTEQGVGDFFVDIVARDREGVVVIENQLEQTDHRHLGQIITYVSGIEGCAKAIWVTTRLRDEHRAAIDWLNEVTPAQYSFFAVELEAYRIGDSPVAPYFYVAAKPNGWSKHVTARNKQLSETTTNKTQAFYRRFWEFVQSNVPEDETLFRGLTPAKTHWWALTLQGTPCINSVLASKRDSWIGAEIYCHKDPEKKIFDRLYAQRSEIENEAGEPFDWQRLDDKDAWRILIRKGGVDITDEARWAEHARWYSEKLAVLRRSLHDRLRRYEPEDDLS